MRLLLIPLLLLVGARFGLLTWGGYRTGRVKSASLWSPSYDRRTQPRFFWLFVVTHFVVFVVTETGAIALALGWGANSN
jgi:hypothetical protein